eukprot:Trichotokara_eunicae@DN6133_c0_g1_i3.p1
MFRREGRTTVLCGGGAVIGPSFSAFFVLLGTLSFISCLFFFSVGPEFVELNKTNPNFVFRHLLPILGGLLGAICVLTLVISFTDPGILPKNTDQAELLCTGPIDNEYKREVFVGGISVVSKWHLQDLEATKVQAL